MGTFKKDMDAFRREARAMEARSQALHGETAEEPRRERIPLPLKDGVPDLTELFPRELRKIVPRIVTILILAAMFLIYFLTAPRR
ncbi:MAG TPA: hypothetical protein PK836_04035 [Syntrophales bacterium]|nr:hypothetical protein [Syntrophales bacterium]HRS87674.1 hypothetical protein [Syntrophales bacterium]